MNNLITKVGIAAAMAATSLFHTGCESVPTRSPSEQRELEERMLGVVLGGWMVNKGVQQDNVAGAVVGDALVNSSLQRDQNVNVNVNYPVSRPQSLVFISNGSKDFNKNGVIEYPHEFVNAGKTNIKVGETIQGTFYGQNNPTMALKGRITNVQTNTFEFETPSVVVENNSMGYWDMAFNRPGIYSLTIVDQNNLPVGQTVFQVTH